MQIAILGRQPSISLAELESLFGGNKITQLSSNAATVDITTPLPQSRLGGTIKSGRVIYKLKSHNLCTERKNQAWYQYLWYQILKKNHVQ